MAYSAERIIKMKSTQLKKDSELHKTMESNNGKPVTRKKGGKKKRLIAAVLAAAVVVAVIAMIASRSGGNKTISTDVYTPEKAQLRNITHELSGSGTLEAADSYSVTTLLQGKILTAPFEEGQIVQKDSALYTIDSTDALNNLEKAQISVDQSQRAYDTDLKNQQKLTITAPITGNVMTLSVKTGDIVTAGQSVARIVDSDVMSLKVYFQADTAAQFHVGDSATVTVDGAFDTLPAAVSWISDADTVLTGSIVVREVQLDVSNPGGLSTEVAASASINGVVCSSTGTFAYKDERTIAAEVSGEVVQLQISEGARVGRGQTLIVLKSDTIDNQLKSDIESIRTAELNLDSQNRQLEDYTITSPISGTIIDKYFKAGDTVETGKVLCTIYDLSFLTMTLDVDELDVADVTAGQEVSITADAVKGQSYSGVITKVSVAGTTSNGVTTYPVTIRIDEMKGLMPGMNVDAKIIIEQEQNVLSIPTDALVRDNMVLITADSPSASSALADEAPEGYVYVAVTTGISDDIYVQILTGLTENDVVAYKKPATPSSTSGFAPGGFGPGSGSGQGVDSPGGTGGMVIGG